MKNHAPGRAAVAVASLTLVLGATPAFGLVELGGGVLNVQAAGSVSYDSNVRGKENGASDTIFRLTPTLTYTRREARVAIELHGMTSAAAYSNDANENHTDYSVGGSANLPFAEGSRLSGGLNFETSKSRAVQELANDLVSTKSLSFGGNLGLAYSENLSFSSSLGWTSTKNAGFGNNESLSSSLGLSWPRLLFARLPLTVSLGRTTTKSDENGAAKLDNASHSLSFGTSGKLTERMTGSINVGWQSTSSDGTEATNGDSSNLNVSTNLSWQLSELLTAAFTLSRGITASPTNDTVLNTAASVSLSRKLTHNMDAALTVSQAWNEFQNTSRSDKTFNASVSLSRRLTETWAASLSASHSKNNSDIGGASFDRNVFTLSSSIRF